MTATLIIGNQKLTGRKIVLKRPLVILQQPASLSSATPTQRVQIAGLIYEKYLFDTRPTTILSLHPANK